MSIFSKVKPIEVNDRNPHEHDALDREKDCLFLVDLIEKSDTPFTLAVDAKWGNGKTIFIKMLQAHLKEKGFRCIFFNAWECDFYSEPLAPLIAEISMQVPSESSAGKTLKEKGLKIAKYIKEVAPSIHISAAVLIEIINIASGNTKLEDLDSIRDYENYRDTLKDFKKSIEEFSSESQNGKPLVVLIDDLDRCRPDFAINTLERVKHIFDVPSLFFVVSVNKKEFSNVVKSFYGCEDGERYLEKFFDLVFHLRNEKNLVELSLGKIELNHFAENIKSSTFNHVPFREDDYRKWFAGYLEFLSKTFQFPLRVQEKLVSMLNIALKMIDYRHVLYQPNFDTLLHQPPTHWQVAFRYPLICYFLALRIANPDLFHKSVESQNKQSFPWKEHMSFYFHKLGIEEHRIFVNRSSLDMSSLKEIEPEENKLIVLSLIAIKSLLNQAEHFTMVNRDQEIEEKLRIIKKLSGIKNYAPFYKLLIAIDFAGRLYEPENEHQFS